MPHTTQNIPLALACVLLAAAAPHAAGQVQILEASKAMKAGNQPHPLSHVLFSNVTVSPRNKTTATISFDVSWTGSWRHEVNHDAAWIFFKVKVDGENEWRHVKLTADKVLNPTGYGQAKGTPLEFIVPDGDDGFTGMIVRPAHDGPPSPLTATKVTALWDLTASPGVKQDTKVALVEYGYKMTYVGEGPFSLGSGGNESHSFYQYTDGSRDNVPYRVTGPSAIKTGKQKGQLWARGAYPEDGGEIPATFPNGYKAFYCMARTVTTCQYADFLRTLPAEVADKFYHAGGYGGYRVGWLKREGKSPDYTYWAVGGGPSGPGGAHTDTRWMSWRESAAFAAWSGLRPMTELEYEKTMRGPREPVAEEAGFSFWNVNFGGGRYNAHPRERPVTVGNAKGRAFTGTHGNGTLQLPADWPQNDAVGIGLRAGWIQWCIGYLPSQHFNTSYRLDAARADTERSDIYGWRGVRTAPELKK